MVIYLNFRLSCVCFGNYSNNNKKNWRPSEKYFTINSQLFCNFFSYLSFHIHSFYISWYILLSTTSAYYCCCCWLEWVRMKYQPPIVVVHNINVHFHKKNFFLFYFRRYRKISLTFYYFYNKFEISFFHSLLLTSLALLRN